MQGKKENSKTEWQKMHIFWYSSWNKIFKLKKGKGHEPSRAENPSARASCSDTKCSTFF